MNRLLACALIVPSLGLVTSCAGRTALHRVVLDYDETVSRAEAEMLLLNVARARRGRPLHFTTVSGIAATFDYRREAGLAGEFPEDPGLHFLASSLGVSFSENPTISIVPIQGEEFTRRLLTPLGESIPAFFYHQGIEPKLLLKLLVDSVVLRGERETVWYQGDFRKPDTGFTEFVDRIARLHRERRLDLGPLIFEESWDLAGADPPSPVDLVGMLEQGYQFHSQGDAGVVSRRVVGRQVLTNYDVAQLSNEERQSLQERAQQYPTYFVLVDLRAHSAEEDAFQGWIKLRSFSSIVDAVAGAVSSDAETTGAAPLQIMEATDAPSDSLFSVRYDGEDYFVPNDVEGGQAEAFRVLHRLYQMTVAEVSAPALPAVTIAK